MPLVKDGSNVVNVGTEKGVERHFHDYDEHWYIIAGKGRAIVYENGERKEYRVEPGDIVITYMGDEHELVADEPISLICFAGKIPKGARQGHLHRGEDDPPSGDRLDYFA